MLLRQDLCWPNDPCVPFIVCVLLYFVYRTIATSFCMLLCRVKMQWSKNVCESKVNVIYTWHSDQGPIYCVCDRFVLILLSAIEMRNLLFFLLVGHKCQRQLKSSVLVRSAKKHIRLCFKDESWLFVAHFRPSSFWQQFFGRIFLSSFFCCSWYQLNMDFTTLTAHISDHPIKLHQIASAKGENKYQRKST